ncbi:MULTISPECIES: hypothetical protein [unclassified Stenotrophomonas maltophilia group]|uniref:hypothetical protein n=1 Tax=unclassified Stenotrophomonas maltophilia group TaxID=2961925 RepID=UPI00131F0BB6|nr:MULTISPECIES: hypothetical protein [unclassified Stenotrophomonas maltophilia group]
MASIEAEPLAGLLNAVNGIVESRPRALGGDVSAQFVQGALISFQDQLRAAKQSGARAQTANDKLSGELSEVREDNARLRSELRGMKSNHALSSLGMTGATILVGVAVDGYKNGSEKLAIVCVVIAAALIIGGWLIPNLKGKDK